MFGERERPGRAAAPSAYVSRPSLIANNSIDPYADVPFWTPVTRWEKKWVVPPASNAAALGQKTASHKAPIYKWVAVPTKKPINFEEEDEEEEEAVEVVMETEDEPEARIVITGSDSGDPVAMEDVAPTVPSPAAATPSAPAVLSAIPSHLRVNTSGFGGDGGSGPSTPGGGAQATPPNSAAVAVNPNPLPLSAMDLTRTLEDVAMRDAT